MMSCWCSRRTLPRLMDGWMVESPRDLPFSRITPRIRCTARSGAKNNWVTFVCAETEATSIYFRLVFLFIFNLRLGRIFLTLLFVEACLLPLADRKCVTLIKKIFSPSDIRLIRERLTRETAINFPFYRPRENAFSSRTRVSTQNQNTSEEKKCR